MRQAIERQRRLDGDSVSQVVLNLNCRDELIPILRGLQQVYATPKVPKPGFQQAAEQLAAQSTAASVTFRAAQQRHPGIESAIGGLQSGNGQKRCRDRGELGLERDLALGILGRNLHTFGRLLIQSEAPQSEAARTQRAV